MDGADAAALARARRRAAPPRAAVPAPARPQHYRVAVLGAAEAGKTALVARWADAPPPATYAPTLGAAPAESDVFVVTADGPARVTFVDWCWDHAADADVTRQMAASDAAVAVFSLADGKSFTRAAVAAVAYGSKRPVVFVGTHSDGKSRCDADAVSKRDAVLCSCATGAGVDRARATLLDALEITDAAPASEDAWLLGIRRFDAYERFLRDDEACVLDLVKRRLGFDDALAPEATVAAALKLLGFAADPDAVLKDNLARAATLHGLDAEEEDDEDEEPDDVFAADASVKKRAAKRVAPAAGDGAAVDVVQASTDEEVTRAARRRARINEHDRADAAAARAARERFFSVSFSDALVLPRMRIDDRPRSLRPYRRDPPRDAGARRRRAPRPGPRRRGASAAPRAPRATGAAAAAEALRAAERARAAALKAALAAEDAATSAEKRDYGLRKASLGAAWPECVVHAGYEAPGGKGVSLRLDVPEAWRDAPLAKLLAAVDAWEMAKARKKAKRGRRPVRARSARCEDLEGYNLDHLSVYEAIEASGGCVVLR